MTSPYTPAEEQHDEQIDEQQQERIAQIETVTCIFVWRAQCGGDAVWLMGYESYRNKNAPGGYREGEEPRVKRASRNRSYGRHPEEVIRNSVFYLVTTV